MSLLPSNYIWYRDHRGSFTDAMSTARKVESMSEIESHLYEIFGVGKVTIDTKSVYDPRNKWNTHMVLFNGNAVGFTNGLF